MEVVHIAVARNKRILARIDNLLESSLSLIIFTGEEVSLTSQSPCKALGHLNGTILIIGALALVEVGSSLLALFSHPLNELLVVHRILRILVAVIRKICSCQYVIYERRIIPEISQQEVVEGTKNTSLSYAALLDWSICCILEVICNEITGIYREIKTGVHKLRHLCLSIVTELIEHTAELVVAIVTTGIEHIIATHIGDNLIRSVDARTTTIVITSHYITHESLISRNQGSLGISISLIEFL